MKGFIPFTASNFNQYEYQLEETFKMIDKDDSGYLSPDEIRQVLETILENVSDDEVKGIISELDKNSDNKISYKGEILVYFLFTRG